MKREGLTVAVILLFIGLAVSPSIYADITPNLDEEDEYVEYSIELCGFSDKKEYSNSIPRDEMEEIKLYFEEMNLCLQNAETDEERLHTYKEILIYLFEQGLIDEEDYNRILRLVDIYATIFIKLKDKIQVPSLSVISILNPFCLTYGFCNEMFASRSFSKFLVYGAVFLFTPIYSIIFNSLFLYYALALLWFPIYFLLSFIYELGGVFFEGFLREITSFSPSIREDLVFGKQRTYLNLNESIGFPEGWMYTYGFWLEQYAEGNLQGALEIAMPGWGADPHVYHYYIGAFGFKGLLFRTDEGVNIIGFSNLVVLYSW